MLFHNTIHDSAAMAVRTMLVSSSRAIAAKRYFATASASTFDTLPGFKFGVYPVVGGEQAKPVYKIRLPKFESVIAERAHRKLHQAAALRWLGYNDYNNEGAGGHVTVRDPEMTDHFWINPHGKSFRHIKPEDLCLVDEHGVVKEGGNMHSINPAGYVIHSAIHKARPDVIAAVHCHSVPSKAFSSLGIKLEPINQDACRFHNDHGICTHHGGIAFKEDEGLAIAEALGDSKAVILSNHGHLTVGKTVDAATFLFGAFDRCIQAQLLADTAAAARGIKTMKISEEVAEFSRANYTDEMTYIMFQSAFEDVVKASNGELSMHVPGELPRDQARS